MYSLVKCKVQWIQPYPRELNQQECIKLLEDIRWGGKPQCPYCGSCRASPIEKGLRHHCNDCFTSYSVTVGTIFHKTHVDLQKWFKAISLLNLASSKISARQLGQAIGVNKNTAASMISKIRQFTSEDDKKLLQMIVQRYRQDS